MPSAQKLTINNEHDVISLRQAVRQMARQSSLGLSKQARITAAISEIARVLVIHYDNTRVTVQIYETNRTCLEIICHTPGDFSNSHGGSPADVLRFEDARALVDEAALDLDVRGIRLSLRMYLDD
jgi:hypothetical protein